MRGTPSRQIPLEYETCQHRVTLVTTKPQLPWAAMHVTCSTCRGSGRRKYPAAWV